MYIHVLAVRGVLSQEVSSSNVHMWDMSKVSGLHHLPPSTCTCMWKHLYTHIWSMLKFHISERESSIHVIILIAGMCVSCT